MVNLAVDSMNGIDFVEHRGAGGVCLDETRHRALELLQVRRQLAEVVRLARLGVVDKLVLRHQQPQRNPM